MVGEWKTVKMQLDIRVFRLLKQEDICGVIALTYFAEICLDLTKVIPKVLFILFPKIYVWEKVYNFFSDGYISLKNL